MLMTPPSVVPPYIVALAKAEAVPRAVVVKLCKELIKTGNINPPKYKK